MRFDKPAAARKIGVIGLGYVGLPVAVAFAATGRQVVAFDINAERVAELSDGIDRTREVTTGQLNAAALSFTTDSDTLAEADFFIVTVPTPITDARLPDLRPLLAASRSVGAALKPGDVVVYESTVYPGATEEDCVPVLEQVSGLKCGRDFSVGYSPERINPGDKTHQFTDIVKIVSGLDADTLDLVEAVYASVVTAGVYRAPTIKTAEAAKVIENTQRDVNIALMNELSLIFQRLGIDTRDVLAAAGTKWNFLPFSPGLVGGHCIGVDPYYLTHRAQMAGHHPEVILSGRRINDGVGAFVARQVVRHLMGRPNGSRPVVTILGLTFKEDVPDIRNTRVVDIWRELNEFGVDVQVADPYAHPGETMAEYGIALSAQADLRPADAVILAVPHAPYRQAGWDAIIPILKDGETMVADVKGGLDRRECPDGTALWRL
ncbi:nucleotide sugar dehydrogenase [Fodinicurvata sp. EGI_FJ10296]|uniref:nucleotide sugar dehydrogenase n=1 Tax=Fodinicurvata sp. EGI_FJ10296 TaxID=3231908 RepID=UPI0034564CE6